MSKRTRRAAVPPIVLMNGRAGDETGRRCSFRRARRSRAHQRLGVSTLDVRIPGLTMTSSRLHVRTCIPSPSTSFVSRRPRPRRFVTPAGADASRSSRIADRGRRTLHAARTARSRSASAELTDASIDDGRMQGLAGGAAAHAAHMTSTRRTGAPRTAAAPQHARARAQPSVDMRRRHLQPQLADPGIGYATTVPARDAYGSSSVFQIPTAAIGATIELHIKGHGTVMWRRRIPSHPPSLSRSLRERVR